MFAGVAVIGYLMFGETTLSQFTLNMPQGLVASKLAVWTTVSTDTPKKLKIKYHFKILMLSSKLVIQPIKSCFRIFSAN